MLQLLQFLDENLNQLSFRWSWSKNFAAPRELPDYKATKTEFNRETFYLDLLRELGNNGVYVQSANFMGDNHLYVSYNQNIFNSEKEGRIYVDRIVRESFPFVDELTLIPVLNEFNDEHVITFLDKDYPDILHSMGVDKPLMLWYNGNLNIGKSIAVIGSRDIHPKTIEITKLFTTIAVDKGFNIVSGLALGTDTVGHKTAVDNSSKTTVILPGPLDTITPSENKELVTKVQSS